jgi:pSer/pThr/pTyr-binding forkhead associated (FHA) protein
MNNGAPEMFQHACGCPGRLDLDVCGPESTLLLRHRFDRPFARIGREPRNDIHLATPNVSGRHAYVQVIAGCPFVVDLGSRSGTRWQGEIREAGWLGPDDTLVIGEFSVRLAPGSAELRRSSSVPSHGWNPLKAGSATRAGLPAFALELGGRSGNLRRVQVDRVLTLVGRTPPCKLQLLDRSVSRIHCALLQTAEGLWAIDLHGRDGMWADDRRVRWARLDDGARLRVGNFPMRVWHERDCLAPAAGPLMETRSIGEPWTSGASNSLGESAASPSDARTLGGTGLSPSKVELLALGQVIGSLVPLLPLGDATVPSTLLQQFGALRQEMLAQVQHCMLVMTQMITTLRQEEMELLREVLERIGGLKQDVRGLRSAEKKHEARRARRNQEAAEPARSLSERPLTPPSVERGCYEAAGITCTGVGSPDLAASSNQNAARGVAADTPSTVAPDSNRVAANPPQSTEARPLDAEASQATSLPGTDGDTNFHAWLSGRVAMLHPERQGVWRKLLATLLRK